MATVQQTASDTYSFSSYTNSNPSSSYASTDRFTFSEYAVSSGQPPHAPLTVVAVVHPTIVDAIIG